MSFRENPEFDTYEAITQLATGEALVSALDEEGIPTVVQRCTILPPQSQMGALDDAIRNDEIINNLLYAKYTQELDRESAYEILEKKVIAEEEAEAAQKAAKEAEKQRLKEEAAAKKAAEKEAAALEKQKEKEAAAADYQELTRLLGQKEEQENLLMELMEQWENAQE